MKKFSLLLILIFFSATTYGLELNSALLRAAELGEIEKAKSLIKNGAKVDVQDYDSYTALMVASKSGNTEFVKFLIDNGADVNITRFNQTALIIASCAGNTEIVNILIENGAEEDVKGEKDQGK